MPSPGKFALGLILFLLGAAWAHAHDPLQASTNIWLRPDKMEVEIIISRAPSRLLADQAPPVPLTEDNFDTVYQPLLKKSAEAMLEITVDGKPLKPTSMEVELFEETDLKFTFVYPRPPNGRLRVTANFIKRMGDGFGNSLGMNEDRKVLGYGDQTADSPDWEVTLASDTAAKPPANTTTPAPPPPLPPMPTPAAAPRSTTPAMPPRTDSPDSYFIIPHFGYATLGVLAVIILLALWRIRQKS